MTSFAAASDALNQIFQTPGVLVLTIAATRMYRSLSDFLLYDRMENPSSDHEFIRLAVLRRPSMRSLRAYHSGAPVKAMDQPVEVEVRIEREVGVEQYSALHLS
ncbi:hypothetical protein PENSPDRAFT_648203 [Peniophora sp. CONT]|nr:hypothetical protein PENSPDRAFT_648203 [Peniophora sp. CONT]